MTQSSQQTDNSTTFSQLGVPERIVSILAKQGKTNPFPIQEDTLPDTLQGRDVLGRGETGSGKTLAYAIPLVTRLGEELATEPSRTERNYNPVRGLILAPTRELVNQIDEVIAPLAATYGMKTVTIYGGVRYQKQINQLRAGAQIVLACPGRLEDLLSQHALKLDGVEITVLDEADLMADLGFLPAVNRLLKLVPMGGQHLFFSATLDHGIDTLVKRFLSNAKVHEIDAVNAHVETMTQHVFEVSHNTKTDVVEALASGRGKRILFTRTKHQAKNLAAKLTQKGIPAAQLHGNLSQSQRDRNMAAFKSGAANVLVATDVAARGVDVPAVELVVQVDPPAEAKSFLHRSGRTARAGHNGDVVTLVLPEQRRETRQMLRHAAIKTQALEVTSNSEEVVELVGEKAEYVRPQELEKAMTEFSRERGRRNNASQGSRGRSNRSNRQHGNSRYGQSERSPRSDRSDRDRRDNRSRDYNDRDDYAGHSKNRSERRSEQFSDRNDRRHSRFDEDRRHSEHRSDRFERSDRSERSDRFEGRGDSRRNEYSDRREGSGDHSHSGYRKHSNRKSYENNPFSDHARSGEGRRRAGSGEGSERRSSDSPRRSSSHKGNSLHSSQRSSQHRSDSARRGKRY